MKISGLLNKKNIIIVAVLMLCVVVVSFVASNVVTYKQQATADYETARAMEYVQVEENDAKTDSEYVSFDAFFLRDLDGDGEAESIRGTCKEAGKEDTLYMELKVSGNGYLENAVITVDEGNYYLNTAIPKDTYVKENAISVNTSKIEFNNLYAGTQKLLIGNVRSGDYRYTNTVLGAIANNPSKYSGINKIILTGTHVTDDGKRTEIRKEVEFNVDWYGAVEAEVYNGPYKGKNYKDQIYFFEDIVNKTTEDIDIKFDIAIAELNSSLLINKVKFEADIPKLNGFNPISVEVLNEGVVATYDENTRVLTGEMECNLDSSGFIVKHAYDCEYTNVRYREFNVLVKYSAEAYESLSTENISLKIPVKGNVVCFNNANEEFENPIESNTDVKVLNIIYSKRNEIEYSVSIGKLGLSPNKRYFVSKEKPLNFYNNIDNVSLEDNYEVLWTIDTATELTTKRMSFKESRDDGTRNVETVIKSDGTRLAADSFINNIGIYFDNAANILGENGWIKVYDDETNDLLATFDKEVWDKFTKENPYKYELPVKYIRVETSEVISSGNLYIYHVKNIDNEYLTENFTKEEFESFAEIETNLVVYENGILVNESKATAIYENPISVYGAYIVPNNISTQATEKDFIIGIRTDSNEYNNKAKWEDAIFLVALPSEIIDVEINKVITDNKNINIKSYEVLEINGNKFIKVITATDEPLVYYDVAIYANLTPNPKGGSVSEQVNVYAYNSYCEYYFAPTVDTHDINGNLNLEEEIGVYSVNLGLVAPNTLLTSQSLLNYDEIGTEIIAPGVGLVDKDRRIATIEVGVRNNYTNTISDVVVLGKIPFVGNSFAFNNQNLNSDFSVTMENTGIIVPESLKGIVEVYYSENEQTNRDLNDSTNGWTKNPSDFSKVKTFLITFNDYVLEKNEEYYFTYNILIPEGVNYNDVAYSHHGIYFSLNTDEGKYKTNAEPNKLGIMIAKEFDLQINKFQENSNKLIPGAIYSVTEEGTEISKTGTTDVNGNIVIEDLLVEKTYVIKEIISPNQYSLNQNEIVFSTVENSEGNLEVNLISGEIRDNFSIVTDETGKNIITVNVEDEVRPNINLIVSDMESNHKIEDARFKIRGKGIAAGGRLLRTNENGEVSCIGLYLNEEYILDELSAEGYYLSEQIKFKIINTDGVYSVQIINGKVQDVVVTTYDEIPTMNISIQNELIPRYNLILNTVINNQNVVLPGVEFKLVKDNKIIGRYTSDENGMIAIPDLFAYETKNDINQTYILKEILAPAGYAKLRDIVFKIVFDETNNVYTPVIESGNVKENRVEGNRITFVIENSPTFKLTKTDSNTGLRLPGVKFEIYDEETRLIARNGHGEFVGTLEEINGEMRYVVTTDENGEVILDLPEGLYKAIEVYAPEKYQFGEEDIRTHYFGIGMSKDETDANIVEVDKIEAIPNSDIINGIEEIKTGGYYAVGAMYSPKIVLENGQSLTKHPDRVVVEYSLSNTDMPNISFEGELERYSDAFIIKYNEDGSIAWASNEGSDIHEEYLDVAVTPDGGCIVAGMFYGEEITFSNGYQIYNNYEMPLGILVKYSATGQIEYVCEYGGYGITRLDKIIETTNGEYIATGRLYNSNPLSLMLDAGGSYLERGEPVLVKLDNSGNLEIIDQLMYEWNRYKDLERTTDGGWLVAGTFEDDFLFNDGDVATSNGTYNNGFIAKYGTNHIVEWKKIINNVGLNSIDQMTDGGYIVGGEMYGYVEFEDGSNLVSNNYCDGLVIRYDKDVNIQWNKSIMRSVATRVNNVVAAEKNSYLVCADTIILPGEDVSEGDISEYELYTPEVMVGFVEKYDKNGNIVWDEYIYDVNLYEDEFLWSVTLADAVKLNKCGDYIAAVNYFDSFGREENYSLNTYGISSGQDIRYYMYNGALIRIRPNGIPERENVDVGNSVNTFKITTNVKVIDNGFPGGYIAGMDLENGIISQPYEIVRYGESNIEPIFFCPFEGCEIAEITINGVPQAFTPDENGIYELPQITNITEDINIEVQFVVSTNKFVINKVDELTGEPLEGAEFNIDQIEERPAVNTEDVVGELVDNGNVYDAVEKSTVINETIGDIKGDLRSYAIIDRDNDISNQVLGTMVAHGSVERYPDNIDIADEVVGELIENNIGQTVINYDKEVTGVVGEVVAAVENEYYFVKENGVYVPTNSMTYQIANGGTAGIEDSQAISYFPIDLTGYTGKYKAVVNITSSCENDYDYGRITFEDTNVLEEIDWYEESIYVTGKKAATDYVSFTLEGGKINYMFAGYFKDSIVDGNEDRIIINSIKIYEAEDATFNFVQNENGFFESTNAGNPATMSTSCVEVDLLDKAGNDYFIYIDNYIYADNLDEGYLLLSETPDLLDSSENYLRKEIISGTQGESTVQFAVAGGYKYYVHFIYAKDGAIDKYKDQFIIKNIRVNKMLSKQYEFIDNGQGGYESNNLGVSYMYASSYIPIDLTNYSGTYMVNLNGYVSGADSYGYGYAYATINKSTSRPSYSTSTGRFAYMYGNSEQAINANDYMYSLEGGSIYYLHLGYYTSYRPNENEKFVVNNINVYGTKTQSFGFEQTAEGKYEPTNIGVNNTEAISQIPIDLTGYTGKYKLVVEAEISSQSNADYGYMVVNSTGMTPAWNTYNGTRIMYASGTRAATNYEFIMTGGSKYYLFLGYRKDGSLALGNDKLTINSINVYGTSEKAFHFKQNDDGSVESTNQGYNNTIANSYRLIDLTDYTGKYNLDITYSISSQSNSDYGYVTITSTETAPSISAYENLIYTSGTVTNKKYTRVLQGGSVYYLHFGYSKDSINHSGDDKFIIHDVSLSLNTSDLYHENVKTNLNGIAMTQLPFGKYEITEVTAPDGYNLNENQLIVDYNSLEDGNITITNGQDGRVIVHHYVKNTTDKVYEDEELKGPVGTEYTTMSKEATAVYELAKDENGEYILPNNMTGTFINGILEVTYYYDKVSVPLRVNHYILGTNQSVLLQDGTEKETENIYGLEGENYTTEPLTPEELNEKYELAEVPTNAEGVFEYDDVVVNYYYRIKTFDIKTNVNGVGGTISGQNMESYENIEYGENSTKEIVITPEEGYYVESVTVNNNPMMFSVRPNRSVVLDTFSGVKEDKEIVVTFALEQGKVIVHHYKAIENADGSLTFTEEKLVEDEIKTGNVGEMFATKESDLVPVYYEVCGSSDITSGLYTEEDIEVIYYYKYKDFDYKVEYYYEGIKDDTKTEIKQETYQDIVDSYTDKNLPGYILEKVEGIPLTISEVVENNIIKVYYVKDRFDYTVEYYYEGVKDDSKTVKGNELFETQITNYEDKVKEGYKFEKVENNPLIITENSTNNVMKVFYIIDESQTKELSYTVEYYKDGEVVDTEVEKVTVQVLESDTMTVNKDKINLVNKYEGYVLESTNPEVIPDTVNSGDTIKVNYIRRSDLSYTVKYLEQGTNVELAPEKVVNNMTFGESVTEQAIEIVGYNKVNPEETITIAVSGNEITFYYTKRTDLSYRVEYYYNNVIDNEQTEVINNQIFGTTIDTYVDKVKVGYKLEKVETLPMVIGVNENVVRVYYVTDETQTKELSYTVEYYKDGVVVDTDIEKVTVQVLQPNTMTVNKDKINVVNKYEGYVLESTNPEVIPDTVNSGDVIKVNYVRRADLSYTVKYLEEGTNIELATEKVVNNVTFGESVTEQAIDIVGYNKVNPEETIIVDVSGNEITFYYTKRTDLAYTVKYLEEGTNVELATEKVVNNVTFGESVTEQAIDVVGYNKVNPEETIVIAVNGNEITFYYTKRTDLSYRVEYYYNNVVDNEQTEIINNQTYGATVDTYEEKVKAGYKLEKVETLPMVIGVNENVLRVYYVTDDAQTKELSYTVEYYKDGILADTEVEKITVQILAPDTMNVDKDKINLVDKYLGYKTENVVIPDIVNSGEVIKVDYVLDDAQTKELSYTVEYYKDGEIADTEIEKVTVQILAPDIMNVVKDKINIVNKYEGYVLENTEPETIPDTVNTGEVIKVNYVRRTDLSYTVKYLEEGTNVELATEKVVNNMTFGENITEQAIDVEGYNKVNPEETIIIAVNGNEITFYYTKRTDLSYRVEYYYNNVVDNEQTEIINNQTYGATVDTYEEKVKAGYKLEKVETLPMVIGVNENVLRVYYVTDDAQTKELSYTVEYYKDGVKIDEDTQVETLTVQILAPDIMIVAKDKINIVNKYEGYVLEGTEPENIPDTVNSGDVIKVNYVRRSDLSYTVKYLEEGTNVELATEKVVNNVTFGEFVTEQAIEIVGYNKVNTEETIIVAVSGNEITFYYTKRTDLSYRVEYYYNNVIEDSATEVINNQTYGTVINTYDDKEKVGYKFERIENLPLVIGVNENILRVYYVTDEAQIKELSYTVEYYKDGEIADTETEKVTVQELEPNTMTVNKDKINVTDKYLGYRLEKTEPDTIPDVVNSGDVIKIYYVIDDGNTKTLSYTVEYYKDGVLAETDVETITVQILAPDTMTVAKDKINLDDKYLGYKTENVVIPDTVVSGDVIRVDYVLDEAQTKELSYTVEYYKDGVLADTDVEKVTVQILAPDTMTVAKDKINLDNKYLGYKTENVVIPDVVTNGTVIRVDYVLDDGQTKELSYTVEYYKDGVVADIDVEKVTVQILEPDTMTVNKDKINIVDAYEGYVLEGTEPENIPDTVNSGAVIKVNYVRRSDLSYTVKYLEEGTNVELATEKVVDNQTFGESVTEQAIDIVGYNKVNAEETIMIAVSGNEITFYYTKRTDLSYRVEYYYNNVIDDSVTEVINNQTYGAIIDTYEDKVKVGYKLEKVEILPMVIGVNENVLRVYYVTDDAQTKELSYTVEYYKDGEIADTEVEKVTVQILDSDTMTVAKDKINLVDKYLGYKTENVVIPDTVNSGDVIRIDYVIDESQTKELSYTVEYYKDEILADTEVEKVTVQILDSDILTVNKDKINIVDAYEGYVLEGTEPEAILDTVVNGDVIKVYYVRRTDLSYRVEYYYNNVIDNEATEVINNQTYGATIDTYIDKVKVGYKLEKAETLPMVIGVDENVVRVYYVTDDTQTKELSYTVEYYKDGVLADTDVETITVQVLESDNMTVNKDKINVTDKYFGYRLEKTEPVNIPDEVNSGDVIKVYYVVDDGNTKTLSYTVEYYKDGVLADTDVEKVTVQILAPDTMTVAKDKINLDDKYLGYKTENVVIPDIVVDGEVIRVDYVLDDAQTKELSYTVEYYKDGVLADTDVETITVQILAPDTMTVVKDKINLDDKYLGYKTENVVIPDTVVNGEVIRVDYVLDDAQIKELSYTVEYYKDDVLVEADTEIEVFTVQVLESDIIIVNKDKINDVDKYVGYVVDEEKTYIPDAVNNGDVIKVYYKTNVFAYRVEYYFENTLNDSLTVTKIGNYGDTITTYEDKVAAGYRLANVENLPLVITENEATNVIKVYYVIDDGQTKDLSYTVEYYKDNVLTDTEVEVQTVQLLDSDEITVKQDRINIVDKYEGYLFDKTEPSVVPTTVKNGDVIRVYYRIIPKIVVKYVDIITGEEVYEEIVLEGVYDETYDITEHLKEREGYTLIVKPELVGEYVNAVEEKAFIYAKNTEIVVKYLEKDTDMELLPEEVISGYEGKEYVSESKDIENYTYVESLNSTGTMTVDPITVVTHYYLQNSKVTVNYIDMNSEEILDTEVFEGKVGDEYTSIAKEFDNYVLEIAPENTTVTLTKEDIVLNYYYLYISEGLVEKHIDIVTGECLETIRHEGNEGDEYSIDSKEFTGYDLVTNERYVEKFIENMFTEEEIEELLEEYEVESKDELFEEYQSELVLKVLKDKGLSSNDFYIPENKEGVLTKDLIEVKYYYVRKSSVKVEYIDKTTNNIITEEIGVDTDGDGINDSTENKEIVVVIEGHEEDNYETVIKDIPGYVIAKDKSGKDILPENAKGNMTKEDTIVRYYYVKVTKVTERHIDIITNEYLEPETVQNGYVGKEYDIKAKDFEGFVLVEDKLPVNSKGEMTESEIIVEYYYIHTAKVIVEYIDKITGEKIPDMIDIDIDDDGFADKQEEKDSTVVFEGFEGDLYKSVQKEFKDYVIVPEMLPNKTEGTMTKEDIIIKYYYVHTSGGVREEHIDIRTDKHLEEPKHYKGNEGDSYNINSKEFKNYDLVTDKLPTNSNGKMNKGEIVVKYYYIKKAEVIVKYEDKTSKEPIATEDKISGHDGDLYKTVPKDVPGYKVSIIPENSEGAMDGNNIIVVTFYYDKVEIQKEEIKDDPKDEIKPNNNVQHVIISNTVTNNQINNKPTNLVPNKDYDKEQSVITPATGDSAPIIVIAVLSITVVANIVYMIIRSKNKKEKKQEETK